MHCHTSSQNFGVNTGKHELFPLHVCTLCEVRSSVENSSDGAYLCTILSFHIFISSACIKYFQTPTTNANYFWLCFCCSFSWFPLLHFACCGSLVWLKYLMFCLFYMRLYINLCIYGPVSAMSNGAHLSWYVSDECVIINCLFNIEEWLWFFLSPSLFYNTAWRKCASHDCFVPFLFSILLSIMFQLQNGKWK